MTESLHITGATKKERYASLLPQLRALVEGEKDFIANVSNLMAGLKYGMGFFWAGIYFVRGSELVLGPFQGPVACTRIKKGKGVCGICWDKKETIIVPDVDQFPGHIACNSDSRSEIVIPCIKNGEVFAVLDVDSNRPNDFDDSDKSGLEEIARLIESLQVHE